MNDRIKQIDQLTQKANKELEELIFYYGHLTPQEHERHILLEKIKDLIGNWQNHVEDLGCEVVGHWKVLVPDHKSGQDITYEHPLPELVTNKIFI